MTRGLKKVVFNHKHESREILRVFLSFMYDILLEKELEKIATKYLHVMKYLSYNLLHTKKSLVNQRIPQKSIWRMRELYRDRIFKLTYDRISMKGRMGELLMFYIMYNFLSVLPISICKSEVVSFLYMTEDWKKVSITKLYTEYEKKTLLVITFLAQLK